MSKNQHRTLTHNIRAIIILIAICILVISHSYAQTNNVITATLEVREGYSFKTIINIPEENDVYYKCIIPLEDKEEIIYPSQIIGYKLENGVTFVSKEINYKGELKKVFLEEVVKDDEFVIYAYVDNDREPEALFMEEQNGKPVQIDAEAEPFKSYLLKDISSKNNLNPEALSSIKANRYSIKNAYVAYSKDNTEYILRKAKFGIIAGYSLLDMKKNDVFHERSSKYSIGLFADIPFIAKQFSAHPELLFQCKNFSDNEFISPDSKSSLREYHIAAPLKLRYTFLNTHKAIKPYVECGGLVGFFLKHNYKDKLQKLFLSESLKQYYIKQGIPIPSLDEDGIAPVYFGAILGGGIETTILKHTVYFGLNYTYTNYDRIKTHDIMLSASFAIF